MIARRRDLQTDRISREGNVLILALLLMTLLAALASAQFAVVQKNVQASSFFLSYSDLHKYAESGISLALHDLNYDLSGNAGNIGTATWTSVNDVGRDGIPATGDSGEGDGFATVGEPNAFPVTIGAVDQRIGLLVHVDGTAFPNMYRVTASATSADGTAKIETYVEKTIATLPKVAAVFVDPAVALDLKGNKFTIDGNDHNPDGTPGPEPAVPGIATLPGDPLGSNQAMLLAQIPALNYDQVLGAGGMPSLGEAPDVYIDQIFEGFLGRVDNELDPATYTDPAIGEYTTDDFQVTHTQGDLHFSGKGEGAGVLLVDGSLFVSGQFTFYGLIIVRGDIVLTGGGAGIHVFGSTMVGESITAVDVDPEVTVSGNADIFYSSTVLRRIELMMTPKYHVVYYDED